MDPKEVEGKFYPVENRRRTEKPMLDFFKYHEIMTGMKHPDLAFIWMAYYKKENPDGYQLTQFYKLYGDFMKENFGQEKSTWPLKGYPEKRCISTGSETSRNCL